MTRLDIHELAIPDDDTAAATGEFAEMVALLNGIERETAGDDAEVYAPEDVLPAYRSQAFEEPITFVARLGAAMVGTATVRFPLEEDAVTATVAVTVAPAVRERGIGSALLQRAEEMVAAGGRTTIIGYTRHQTSSWPETPGPRIGGIESTAVIPQRLPEVRFLTAHGYRLGQVEQTGQCALPTPPGLLESVIRDATTAAGGDYDAVSWQEHAPDEWVEQFATLRNRMSLDVPQAGVTIDDEEWTAARVREFESMMIRRQQPLLTSAVVHRPTHALAAYTEIVLPAGARTAEQHDTLVAPEHRGRRLAVLVKAENLRHVQQVAPRVSRVLTWNAEENTRMLAVNDELGFRLRGYLGTWEKIVAADNTGSGTTSGS